MQLLNGTNNSIHNEAIQSANSMKQDGTNQSTLC